MVKVAKDGSGRQNYWWCRSCGKTMGATLTPSGAVTMDEKKGKHRCVFDQFDREEPMGYYCKCGKRENSPQHSREDKRGHRT